MFQHYLCEHAFNMSKMCTMGDGGGLIGVMKNQLAGTPRLEYVEGRDSIRLQPGLTWRVSWAVVCVTGP